MHDTAKWCVECLKEFVFNLWVITAKPIPKTGSSVSPTVPGMLQGRWQRAKSIELASKLLMSQPNQGLMQCKGTEAPPHSTQRICCQCLSARSLRTPSEVHVLRDHSWLCEKDFYNLGFLIPWLIDVSFHKCVKSFADFSWLNMTKHRNKDQLRRCFFSMGTL